MVQVGARRHLHREAQGFLPAARKDVAHREQHVGQQHEHQERRQNPARRPFGPLAADRRHEDQRQVADQHKIDPGLFGQRQHNCQNSDPRHSPAGRPFEHDHRIEQVVGDEEHTVDRVFEHADGIQTDERRKAQKQKPRLPISVGHAELLHPAQHQRHEQRRQRRLQRAVGKRSFDGAAQKTAHKLRKKRKNQRIGHRVMVVQKTADHRLAFVPADLDGHGPGGEVFDLVCCVHARHAGVESQQVWHEQRQKKNPCQDHAARGPGEEEARGGPVGYICLCIIIPGVLGSHF